MYRGGGDDSTDWVTTYRDTTNCSEMCASVMIVDGLGAYPPNPAAAYDPHYIKCYDAGSPMPLNGIRVAFVSQMGTTNVDPGLPQIFPITNITACMRTNFAIITSLTQTMYF